MRLNNKVAVITGAAGILGAQTAQRFLGEGARVVLVDQNAQRLSTVAQGFNPDMALCVQANVASAAEMQSLVQSTEQRFGGIDIFFANAGIEGITAMQMEDCPDEVFDRVMEVNVRGVYMGIKAVLPRMKAGGSVMITSSIAGLMGTPYNIAYGASKHAVIGIRRSCASLGGPRQIRVNTIHPGYVESDMLDRLIAGRPDPAAFKKVLAGRALFGRLTRPEEVANVALFLASDESSGITNQGLVVDCGTLN